MITLKELNPKGYDPTVEQAANLAILLERINKVRKAYGKPMIVTSGLRSNADQQRINPSAPRSKHLMGAAVDIADKDADLYNWARKNESLLAEIGLWCEDGRYTLGWVHFQILPPRSGKRFFIP